MLKENRFGDLEANGHNATEQLLRFLKSSFPLLSDFAVTVEHRHSSWKETNVPSFQTQNQSFHRLWVSYFRSGVTLLVDDNVNVWAIFSESSRYISHFSTQLWDTLSPSCIRTSIPRWYSPGWLCYYRKLQWMFMTLPTAVSVPILTSRLAVLTDDLVYLISSRKILG
jgi:hypothetical protein